MKQILLILCVSLLCSCGTKELSSDQLVERNGIIYEINSEVPYWGKVKDTYENGQLSSKGSYSDGLKDGLWEYYENGQLSSKGSYWDGLKHGWWDNYENGQLGDKKEFDKGTLKVIQTYENDVITKIESLWDHGGPFFINTFENGVKSKTETFLYGGSLNSIKTYENGVISKTEYFNVDGTLGKNPYEEYFKNEEYF